MAPQRAHYSPDDSRSEAKRTTPVASFPVKEVEDTETNPMLKRLIASARENDARFRTLAEHFDGVISIYDAELAFVYVNHYGQTVAMRTLNEMLHRTDEELFPPEVCACYVPQLRRVLETGRTQTFEVTFPQALDRATAIITYVPLLNAGGKVEQILTIARDVTERSLIQEELGRYSQRLEQEVAERTRALEAEIEERKKVEARLLAALEREQSVSVLKSRFVSMVSHEYRHPLTSILTATDLLLKYGDKLTDDQKHDYILRIQANVRDMTLLMEDVLSLSRLENGRGNFFPEPLDLDTFTLDLCQTVRQLHHPDHPFTLVTTGDPIRAMADPRLLRSIITNLMMNAFKFSVNRSPVTLTLSRKGDQIVLIVEDRGIGIPAADQPRLFESFMRGENATRIQGTGLGLTITRLSVELHGGDISFTSTEGVGTTFTVMLPFVPADVPA